MTTGRVNQNGWLSTEPKEAKTNKNKQKQTKTIKKQHKNKEKQKTTQERECEMAESLRQAYDYWQDQPGCFSTESNEQNQTKARKTIKNNEKQKIKNK